MDAAICGDSMRCGFSRCGVYLDFFDRIIAAMKRKGAYSYDVTRRRLTLGAKDSVTGWYKKRYSDTTVEGALIPRSSPRLALLAGTYVRRDYLFLTPDPVEEYDEIFLEGTYYEVKATRLQRIGDSSTHLECDLTVLSLHEASSSYVTGSVSTPSSYTITSPSVESAIARTKTYWETYIDKTKMGNCNFTVCYSNADYPFVKVFKEKGMDIILAISQPNSTPMMDPVTQAPYGYEEHVPTHVLTVDKTDITGLELFHLAEAEMRRVAETYPAGSRRSLSRQRSEVHFLGSTRLYDTPIIMNYRRDTT